MAEIYQHLKVLFIAGLAQEREERRTGRRERMTSQIGNDAPGWDEPKIKNEIN